MRIWPAVLFPLLTALAPAAQGQKPEKAPPADDRDLAVRAKLEAVVPMSFENVPLGDVIKAIKGAVTAPEDPGLPIFVDPEGLKAAGVTLATPITYKTEAGEPLRVALTYLLGVNKLRYEVKGGLLRITVTPAGAALVDRRVPTRIIRDRLKEPVGLHFKEAPLQDVLKFIKNATSGPNDAGVPIYVDPVGLQEAEQKMTAPVTIDSKKDEPLAASLRRLLKPIGLAYTVKDGLLTITSLESLDEDRKPADRKEAPRPKGEKPE